MKIKDAIVLAGGNGVRLWPLTDYRPKPLLKIAGKPMLERIVDGIVDAGIKHIVIIADYLMEKVMEFAEGYAKAEVEVVKQVPHKGTAYAIYSGKDYVGEHFLVASGDHTLDTTIYRDMVNAYKGKGMIALKPFEDGSNYGVAVVEDGVVVDMEEKPEKPRSNLVNIGIYAFNRSIFDEIEGIKLSPRGEYEITDVLVGKEAFITEKYWIDVGYPWNVLDANKWLIDNAEEKREGEVINSRIEGKLILGKNSKVIDSVIEGDVYIGDNTVIGPFAYIRGTTSIGNNCSIGNSTVKNSVIGDNVNAKHFAYIGDSVIGDNVNFGSSTQIANLRFDEKEIMVNTLRGKKPTGRKKFGAAVGDNVRFGVNVSVLPGKLIGSDAFVYPGSVVKRNVRNGEHYKG